MPHAPKTVELDEHLDDVVGALHGAVGRGCPTLDHSAVVDQTLLHCKETLDEVMAGKVSDWVK